MFYHSVFHTDFALRLPMVWLYIGPETFLPLTAFLAALLGTVLLGWRHLRRCVGFLWPMGVKKAQTSPQAHSASDSAG